MAKRPAGGRWAKDVARACAERGLTLTPSRRGVVDVLSGAGEPLGAYAILDELSRREGRRVSPPTVYRALEFLLENDFVHRIESRNLFAPCRHMGHAHAGVLLVCGQCGGSEEIESADAVEGVLRLSAEAGFAPHGELIEVQGRCRACAAQ